MRSLETSEYNKILNKLSKAVTPLDTSLMKEWDETRTDINPNAKWYDKPMQQTINKSDVIAILTDVAKNSFNLGASYEDVLEVLLLIEDRVKRFKSNDLSTIPPNK